MDLRAMAGQIPSMGGTKLSPLLTQAARNAPPATSIVEVGTWLGAGTAQLALGIREKPDPGEVSLHCYDRWRATPLEAEAAARWGVRLSVGEDTLPRTRRTLEPFNVPVRFHKGDILQSCWDGGPISVYVDDAAKSPREFCHMLLTFGPSWVPGQTVLVLMDYNFWKKTALVAHKCQKHFIEANSASFEPIAYAGPSIKASFAMFRYKKSIDAIRDPHFRDLWHIWLHLRRKPGALSLLATPGCWRDFWHLFWLHLRFSM